MLDVAGDMFFIFYFYFLFFYYVSFGGCWTKLVIFILFFIFIFLFFLLCELWWMLDVAGDIRRAYKACI